jgi:enamine deaminase RidA (YjgF/YER057c/UK114 family)
VGFSHAAASGGTVWLGGQIGSDAEGRITSPGDIAAQFELALRNLAIALEAGGCRPQDVVKLTYLVTDAAAYRAARKQIGAAYRAVFGRHFPASTLMEVKGLYDPEALVEIEAVAIRPT